MHRHVDEAIAELARTQCSAFSHQQAYALGADRRLLYRRRRAGTFTDEAPGVCGFPGAPDTFERRLWIAHLALGERAVVSHESAAALHHLPGFPPGQPTLTVPHTFRPRIGGIAVHRISDLLELTPGHVTRDVVPGLPVTDTTRTLVDLGAVAHPARLRLALEEAVHRRLTSDEQVGACLLEVARQGKGGIARMARLLDERTGRPASTSEAERLFLAVVEGRVPAPEVQRPLPGVGLVGICDCRWCDARLVVEVDSRSWHARIQDIKRDRERDAQAARAGWLTVRFLYEHVRADPEGTVAELLAIRATRLRQFGAA